MQPVYARNHVLAAGLIALIGLTLLFLVFDPLSSYGDFINYMISTNRANEDIDYWRIIQSPLWDAWTARWAVLTGVSVLFQIGQEFKRSRRVHGWFLMVVSTPLLLACTMLLLIEAFQSPYPDTLAHIDTIRTEEAVYHLADHTYQPACSGGCETIHWFLLFECDVQEGRSCRLVSLDEVYICPQGWQCPIPDAAAITPIAGQTSERLPSLDLAYHPPSKAVLGVWDGQLFFMHHRR